MSQGVPAFAGAAGSSPGKTAPAYLIFFVGALIAIGPLSLDAYLPAMPAMAEAFGVNIVAVNNTISIYLVGYGLGQFFGGAFSDQIGRKRIGLIGLAIFTLASIAIGFAHSVEQVQWLRLIQAIGGGFSTVICMAIVRDVYPVAEIGRRMATVTLIMLASPIVAPSIGAALLSFGWPTIFFFKAFYSGVLLVAYALFVPETRPGKWSHLSVATTVRQCGQVLVFRTASGRWPMLYAFAMALGAGAFMTFLTNSSFVYIEYFGVSEHAFPLYFGASILGMVAMNILSMRTLTEAKAPGYFRAGLYLQLVGVSILLVAALLGPWSIWVVVAAMTFVVASLGLTGPAGSGQYIRNFDKLAGSASSLYTTLMFALGATLSGISGLLFNGTLKPMALVMFAASVGANLLASRITAEPVKL
jgi:DHA1 family bicyclomycin/chloramphenicol resistance-like MFS transporter